MLQFSLAAESARRPPLEPRADMLLHEIYVIKTVLLHVSHIKLGDLLFGMATRRLVLAKNAGFRYTLLVKKVACEVASNGGLATAGS